MSYSNNPASLGPLPQGWIEEKDPQGRSYFVDTTQPNPHAVWDDPRAQQAPQYQQHQNQYAPPSDGQYQQAGAQGQSPYPPVSGVASEGDKGLMSSMMGKVTGQNQNIAQNNPQYTQQYNGQQYSAQPQCELSVSACFPSPTRRNANPPRPRLTHPQTRARPRRRFPPPAEITTCFMAPEA